MDSVYSGSEVVTDVAKFLQDYQHRMTELWDVCAGVNHDLEDKIVSSRRVNPMRYSI